MIVSVPPPIPALGLYPAVYIVRDVAEADRKLAAVLAGIEAVGERWVLDTAALCRVLAAWAAVDALLEARMVLLLAQWWRDSWPGDEPPDAAILDRGKGSDTPGVAA